MWGKLRRGSFGVQSESTRHHLSLTKIFLLPTIYLLPLTLYLVPTPGVLIILCFALSTIPKYFPSPQSPQSVLHHVGTKSAYKVLPARL